MSKPREKKTEKRGRFTFESFSPLVAAVSGLLQGMKRTSSKKQEEGKSEGEGGGGA